MKVAFALIAVGAALTSLGFQSPSATPQKPLKPTFKNVAAVFQQSCIRCHGGDRPRGHIDLTTYEGVIKGGEDGPILKTKDPAHSLILRALRGQGVRQMPPRGGPLREDQIKLIESWIRAGAKNN